MLVSAGVQLLLLGFFFKKKGRKCPHTRPHVKFVREQLGEIKQPSQTYPKESVRMVGEGTPKTEERRNKGREILHFLLMHRYLMPLQFGPVSRSGRLKVRHVRSRWLQSLVLPTE